MTAIASSEAASVWDFRTCGFCGDIYPAGSWATRNTHSIGVCLKGAA